MRFKVYRLTSPSGLVYIGFTERTISRRFYEHVWDAENGGVLPLHKAIRKYGKDSFVVELISRHHTKEAGLKSEIKHIRQHQSDQRGIGYNIAPGGNVPPSWLGKKHNEKTLIKCSEARRAWHANHTVEEKRKHSETGVMARYCNGSYAVDRNASTLCLLYNGKTYISMKALCSGLHWGRVKVRQMILNREIQIVGKIPSHYQAQYGHLGA